MRKLFIFDVETTGLDPICHDIIQLAYIIDIDNEVRDRGCLYIRPEHPGNIQEEALKVNGRTVEEISGWPSPDAAYRDFIDMLSRHVDQYDSQDKFYPVAYNGHFDYDFLSCFFTRRNDPYFGSWFNHRLLDPLSLIRFLDFQGHIDSRNLKLKTMCDYFSITPPQSGGFHDAIYDVEMLRQLFYRVLEFIYPPEVSSHV